MTHLRSFVLSLLLSCPSTAQPRVGQFELRAALLSAERELGPDPPYRWSATTDFRALRGDALWQVSRLDAESAALLNGGGEIRSLKCVGLVLRQYKCSAGCEWKRRLSASDIAGIAFSKATQEVPNMIIEPITEDDVFERLCGKLQAQGLTLHRGILDGAADDDRGRFYTTVGESGPVQDRHVDLERWARRQGVLKVTEALVPSHGEVI